MDPATRRARPYRSHILSAALLLSALLAAAVAALLLVREERSTAILVMLTVAAALALLEWPGRTTAAFGIASGAAGSGNHWRAAIVVTFATFALYLPTLPAHFVADDFGYVQLYSHPSLGYFLRLLTMDQSQGIWGYNAQEFRPLGGLSYMVDYWLWGTNPLGYHLTAVLLHVASTLAVFGIAKRAAGLSSAGAALAGLLFGLLPIHSESVAWINGSRVDALPSMFYLVAFWAWVLYRTTARTRYLLLCCTAFVGSLMSKEIAVTLPAMLVSYDLFRWLAANPEETSSQEGLAGPRWRTFLLPYIPIAALFAAYLVLRGAIFENVLREGQWVFSFREAFSSVAGFTAQFSRLWQEFASLHAYNLRLFLTDYSPAAVGFVLGVALAWTLALLRAGNARNRRAWVLYFGPVWYLLACLPLLVTYHSPRHLYLPMAGPCIALACLGEFGWQNSGRRVRLVRIASAATVVVIAAALLWRQNTNWKTAGEISATLARALPAALEATPPEALVIAWTPSDYNKAYAWTWIMPFALQPPFVPSDLYSNSRIIEFPDMYCCAVEQWWQRKYPILLAVLGEDARETVEVHRLAWDQQNSRVSRLQLSVPKAQLRALMEQAVGAPVEQAEAISYDAAIKLMTTFMDLTAQGR